jgi:hypothetical protein
MIRRIAPSTITVVPPFDVDTKPYCPQTKHSLGEHAALLAAIQRTRGAVYAAEGAIDPSVLVDGRHESPLDRESWHACVVGADGDVQGTIRLTLYPGGKTSTPPFALLNTELFRSEHATDARKAVEAFVLETTRAGLAVGEVGGWALAPSERRGAKGLLLALMVWVITRRAGGVRALATVTTRNRANDILTGVGGWSLEGVPLRYFDPQYGCEMQLMAFDSRRLSSCFESVVSELDAFTSASSVISRAAPRFSADLELYDVGAP